MEEKDDDVFKNLRLKKIEWTMSEDNISSFRITLSDGTVSPPVGKSELRNVAVFPDEKSIRSVRVEHSKNNFHFLQFLDAEKEVIAEVGKQGKRMVDGHWWDEIELKEGEEIVGFRATEDFQNMRGIDFIIIKK